MLKYAFFIIEYFKFKLNPIAYSRKRGVKIGEGCTILGKDPFGSEPYLITIGNNVRINHDVKLITHDGNVWVLRHLQKYVQEERLEDLDLFGTITIGNNVQLNDNVIVLRNVKIGNNVIVGAGAIVTKDIPDNTVVAGIPAKVICTLQDYYKKHYKEFDHTYYLHSDEKREYLLKQKNWRNIKIK